MINDPNYVPYTRSVSSPTRGNDPYGSSDFAKSTPLNAKPPVEVSKPAIGIDYAFNGITKSASTTGAHGRVETTASNENLSKRFKYPQTHQSVPEDYIALDTEQPQG